jgi:hypothetical protein
MKAGLHTAKTLLYFNRSLHSQESSYPSSQGALCALLTSALASQPTSTAPAGRVHGPASLRNERG